MSTVQNNFNRELYGIPNRDEEDGQDRNMERTPMTLALKTHKD